MRNNWHHKLTDYQGDIGKAFDKAKEVGFDSDELAKFSVDMSFEKTNVAAVSSYQNVQQNNLDRDDGHGKSKHHDKEESASIKDIAKFMHRMDKLMSHNAFDFMRNADKSMSDLLKSTLALQDNQESDKAEKSGYKSLDDMIGALQKQHHQSDD